MGWAEIGPVLIDVFGRLAVDPARANTPPFKAEWEEGKRSAMHTKQNQAVTLKVTSLRDVGLPKVVYEEIDDADPGENVRPNVFTDVIFTLNIRAEVPTRTDDHWAFTTIQRIRNGLWFPAIKAEFLAANLALVRVHPTAKVSAKFDDRVHSIATIDTEWSTVMDQADPVPIGWIERIELTSHIKNPGGGGSPGVPPNWEEESIPPE